MIIPATDAGRAKACTLKRQASSLTTDHRVGKGLRVVQLTPIGSACLMPAFSTRPHVTRGEHDHGAVEEWRMSVAR